MIILILGLLAAASAGTSSDNKDNYKNQFRSSGHAGKHKEKHENFSTEYCTDPRTMKKHAAYTEWADAYSCTRHRCQPGGRNLAIYTVGCKRVEAPESAIECEEVVEDTNMQFPFCCTRLRCLVVVRGEVWTRVLGQPWEVLPAAPWSHMYKMKKPPPSDSTFLSKTTDQGPVYELAERESDTEGHEKVLRASPKKDNSDYNEEGSQSARPPLPPPDIVIALSTNEEKESSQNKNDGTSRRSKHRKANVQLPANYFQAETETEKHGEPKNQEVTDVPPETTASTEKPPETAEDETTNNNYAATETATHRSQHSFNTVSWTEIPQNQWVEPKEGAEMESHVEEHSNNFRVQDTVPHLEMSEPKKNLQIPLKEGTADKPSNLQALVDAIGSRMRDIESVVQKMSDKVHRVQTPAEGSSEKRMSAEREKSHRDSKRPSAEDRDSKRPSAEDDSYKRVSAEREKSHRDSKRPSAEDDSYKRFPTNKERGSKYLHLSVDSNTEKPLFIEDSYNLTGYFSDASNSVLRRNNPPKEPPPTYMAPVDTRRKGPAQIAVQNTADDVDKKHKKRTHKKRKGKGSRSHRKHSHSKDGRKRFNKLSSGEAEKNAVSLEDSSGVVQ